ncbi:hypothetical protein AMJ80_11370 [bacterium SM23_31]|nr:MAG: hypothetical protein AMJ80_11370 [bacterium SM23_31]
MEKHVTLFAALNIGFGALGVFIALIIFVAVVGGGLLSGDAEAMAITSIVGIVVAAFFIMISVPDIIGGIGLLKYKPWARILVLIIAVLDLFWIPIGTAIGIYTIWVLLQDETVKLFTPPPKL